MSDLKASLTDDPRSQLERLLKQGPPRLSSDSGEGVRRYEDAAHAAWVARVVGLAALVLVAQAEPCPCYHVVEYGATTCLICGAVVA